MLGPYRQTVCSEVLEADTRQGLARLDVGPMHAVLEVLNRARISVTASWLNLTIGPRERHPRSYSVRTDKLRIMIARRFPTGDVALWVDPPKNDDNPNRAYCLEPLRPIDATGLAASRALDLLGERLGSALVAQGCVADRAVEFGRGENRVLLVVAPDRMLVYARPLFRERLFRKLEVHADGTVVLPGRGKNHKDRRLECRSRWDIVVRGDFVAVESTTGETAEVWLPWISPTDRAELVSLLGLRLS